MADLMQQAHELANACEQRAQWGRGSAWNPPRDSVGTSRLLDEAASLIRELAALHAAPEVVGEVWRLVNSDGGQFGGLYDSEWHASAAQLRYPGDRTGAPFTVQRLELIAARPQGVKDAS